MRKLMARINEEKSVHKYGEFCFIFLQNLVELIFGVSAHGLEISRDFNLFTDFVVVQILEVMGQNFSLLRPQVNHFQLVHITVRYYSLFFLLYFLL